MKNKNLLIYQIACLLLIIFVIVLLLRPQIKKEEENMNSISVKEAALSVIQNRKSVRDFITEKPVSQDDIRTIIQAGMAAPSGRDARPWQIVVVDDRTILDNMASGLPYAKMLAEAPLAIVVCGDTTQSSYWYVDCSAVTENILLAVEALGLGAVWTAAYPYKERMDVVSRNIGLPAHIKALCVIPLGYPSKDYKPKDKYDESKIHYNKWQSR